MSRRRILHLADSPYFGGITSHILSVAEAFGDDPDWEIVVATLPGKREDRTLYTRAASADLDITTIEMTSTFDLAVRARLRDFVESNRITAVHTHAYRANVIANLSKLGVPVMTTSHGLAVQPALRLRLWQAMHLRFLRNQPAVIACSAFVSEQLVRCGVPRDRIQIVHNACAEPHVASPGLTRAELGIAADAVVALYIGRLDDGKRLELVIRALADQPNYHLLIVGDGPTRADLEREAHALSGAATFTGATADPNPYYAIADIVVLPTEMEALPMTLIEAAAHGKPVIASNVGGVSEVVSDGVTGILIDGVDQWVEALSRMLDEDTRTRFGRAARDRHREAFSIESLRRSLADVYSRAVAS